MLNSRPPLIVLLLAGFWNVGGGLPAWGQAPEPPAPSPKLQYLISRLNDLQLRPTNDPSSAYKLQPKPLMEFHNPISGAEGAIFLWTSSGRPVVLAKCHINDIKQYYIRSSTSMTTESFVTKQGDQAVWSCAESGVQFKTVEDSGKPADREPGRLMQMRALSRRFRMQSVWGDESSSIWELRLLPTPLYRYSCPSANVVDGAIFGFAQDTNPEGVVLVEAVKTDHGPQWQVAAARLTGYALKGWFDDRLVLDALANREHGPLPTHHHVYERLRPYPFPKASE